MPDIAHLIRLVERLVDLRDGRRAFGVDRIDVVEHLPLLAVDRAVNEQAGGQLDVGAVLAQEGRADAGDGAHMPEVKVQVAPLAVGEAEERAVGVRRARRMLAVGERGVAFGRIVEGGRVVPPKRVHQLNLHRLAGDEVDGVVVIALGGIPVGRLAAGLQLQRAVVVLHRLRVIAGVLALVLIDAQLVGERPARQAGDGDADVARMDGAGQRRGVGDLNRVRQPLRRQDVARRWYRSRRRPKRGTSRGTAG